MLPLKTCIIFYEIYMFYRDRSNKKLINIFCMPRKRRKLI